MTKRRSDNGVDLTPEDAAHVASARPAPFPVRQDLPELSVVAEAEAAPVVVEVEPASLVTSEAVAELYLLLGHAESLLAAWLLKMPVADAQQIFVPTEKEQAALVPPTVRLLQKYPQVAEVLLKSKYADEIMLAWQLGSMTYGKVLVAIETSARLQAPPSGAADGTRAEASTGDGEPPSAISEPEPVEDAA